MRNSFKLVLIALAFIVCLAALAMVSANASADTHTWISDGAANSDAAAAWDVTAAPEAGDNLAFNSVHVGTCTINQALTFGTITLGAGSGSVTQGAVSIGCFDLTVAGGTWTGNGPTYTTTISGNILWTAGTWQLYKTNAVMTGTGKTITGSPYFVGLTVTGSVTSLNPDTKIYGAGGVFSVSGSLVISGSTFVVHTNLATFSIAGTVSGTGQLQFFLSYGSFSLSVPGSISCPVLFDMSASTAASRTCTLTTNLAIGNTLTIQSSHASNTNTLDLNGKSLTATSITASTRGIISSSVAGAKITTTAGITVSANGQLDATNIAWISCGTNWDSSAGTWTPGTNQVNMTGTGTTKLAGGQTFYNLFAANGGTTRTLLSNIVVTNHKRVDGTLAQDAYTVTISGSNAKPLEMNGTTSGAIAITSSAASYTVYTKVAMGAGSVSTTKECTFIFTGGQVTVTPDSGTANVSMKSWTWTSPGYYSLYVGETVGGANVSFVLSTLQLNGRYDLYLDGVFASTWMADGYGDLYFYHATWSGHLVELRSILVITSGAPATTVNEYVAYYYNGTADESGTWSLVTAHSWMSVGASTGKVTGTPDYSDVAVETVSLRVTNTNGTAYLNWTLTVENVATVWIDESPPLTAHQLGTWTYDFNCTQEGVSVVYSAVCSVPDLTINPTTGVLTGKLMGDVDVTVTVTADDQAGSVITHTFTILVSPPDFEGTWGPMIISLGALMLLVAFMVIVLTGIKRW